MRLKLFLLIISIGFVLNIDAQSFLLHGRVLDADNKPIEFASVSVLNQGKFALTSSKGEFSISLFSADSVRVKFSMIGYKTKTKVLIKPRGKQTLLVIMYPSDNTLETVQVTGQKIQSGLLQNLKKTDLQNLNSGANSNTVEKLVQLQSGVSTHSEFSSQYNVRGGSFDENSIYINGNEIYRPFLIKSGQQEGLSAISPYMVENIDFSNGGFTAKYGDKMSSVLDITYKKPEKFESVVSASLMSADAYIGFGNKKFSWTNSFRYNNNRFLLNSLETSGEYRPNFTDYQTYFSYRPNSKWSFDIIGNYNSNHYNFYPKTRETTFGTMDNVKSFNVYFDGQENDIFKTTSATFGITRQFSPISSISLIASSFTSNEKEQYDIQSQYWLTQTESQENLGVGTFFEHARNYLKANVNILKLILKHNIDKHNIEAGITLKDEHIKEYSNEYEMRDSSGYSIPHTGNDLNMIYSLNANNRINSRRIESYIQDTWKFSSANENTLFTLNYGARISHWSYNKETIVSPRISLVVIPSFNKNITLRLATGVYYQAPFFKELRDTTSTNGITTVSLNNKIKSQKSIHIIAGMDYRFNVANRPFKFSADAYYKILSNLIPYSVNNVKVVYDGRNEASGHAAGIDFKLYGEFVPNTNSWITLSLMNTKMNIKDYSVPLPTDQRYAINLFYTDYFPGTDKWKLSLSLSYADGLPFSTPHNEYGRSSFRAPAYKRADIGMSYRLVSNANKEKPNVFKNIWLGIECLNLFGINNVNSYYWITDVTNQQYAVPNYLSGRLLNTKITFEF